MGILEVRLVQELQQDRQHQEPQRVEVLEAEQEAVATAEVLAQEVAALDLLVAVQAREAVVAIEVQVAAQGVLAALEVQVGLLDLHLGVADLQEAVDHLAAEEDNRPVTIKEQI